MQLKYNAIYLTVANARQCFDNLTSHFFGDKKMTDVENLNISRNGEYTCIDDTWIYDKNSVLYKILIGKSKRETGLTNDHVHVLWSIGRSAYNHDQTLHSIDGRLYSYGALIAVRCTDGSVLINSDRYSYTTERHKPTYTRFGDGVDVVRVSFHTLTRIYSISYPFRELKCVRITDCNNESHSAILEYENHYVLKSRDESGEFIIDFGFNAVKNVEDAIKRLLPSEIKYRDDIDCKRQGEWFFVPVDDDIKISKRDVIKALSDYYKKGFGAKSLKLGNHVPRDMYIDKNGRIYVRGTVRHVHRDHRMLNLGNTWHLVIRSKYVGLRSSGVD